MEHEKDLEEILKKMYIHSIPGFFTVMDITCKYVTVNPLTIDLIGYKSTDQLAGTTYFDMPCKASESADIFIKEDMAVLESSRSIKMISYQCFDNNKWTAMIGEKSPIMYEGKTIGVIAHFIDVTNTPLIDLSRFLIKNDSNFKSKMSRNSFSYVVNNDGYETLKLSKRQAECLFFLLRGKTSREIGEMLHLSVRTIEGYIEEIKMKLNCHTKSDIIEKSINSGYLNIIPTTLLK